MIIRILVLSLTALVAAACSTVSRDMTFAGGPGQGFAMVVADGMVINGSESYRFNFQGVDLGTSEFLDETFSITFSGMGPMLEGNEFRKPEGMNTSLRFGGREVRPGDYALVSRADHASYGTFNSTLVNCFSMGAVVVSVSEGAVTVIPGGHVKDARAARFATDLDQVAQVLAGYPNIIASVSRTALRGSVTFATGRTFLGGDTCNATGAFTFTPLPAG